MQYFLSNDIILFEILFKKLFKDANLYYIYNSQTVSSTLKFAIEDCRRCHLIEESSSRGKFVHFKLLIK